MSKTTYLIPRYPCAKLYTTFTSNKATQTIDIKIFDPTRANYPPGGLATQRSSWKLFVDKKLISCYASARPGQFASDWTDPYVLVKGVAYNAVTGDAMSTIPQGTKEDTREFTPSSLTISSGVTESPKAEAIVDLPAPKAEEKNETAAEKAARIEKTINDIVPTTIEDLMSIGNKVMNNMDVDSVTKGAPRDFNLLLQKYSSWLLDRMSPEDLMRSVVFNIKFGINMGSVPKGRQYTDFAQRDLFSIRLFHALTARFIQDETLDEELVKSSYINSHRPELTRQKGFFFHPGYEYIVATEEANERAERAIHYLFTLAKSLTSNMDLGGNKKKKAQAIGTVESLLGHATKVYYQQGVNYEAYFDANILNLEPLYAFESQTAAAVSKRIIHAILDSGDRNRWSNRLVKSVFANPDWSKFSQKLLSCRTSMNELREILLDDKIPFKTKRSKNVVMAKKLETITPQELKVELLRVHSEILEDVSWIDQVEAESQRIKEMKAEKRKARRAQRKAQGQVLDDDSDDEDDDW